MDVVLRKIDPYTGPARLYTEGSKSANVAGSAFLGDGRVEPRLQSTSDRLSFYQRTVRSSTGLGHIRSFPEG